MMMIMNLELARDASLQVMGVSPIHRNSIAYVIFLFLK